jgi:hypothetical protein
MQLVNAATDMELPADTVKGCKIYFILVLFFSHREPYYCIPNYSKQHEI